MWRSHTSAALREYLNRHGELPDQTLVAACPISLRDAGDNGSGGNMLFGRLQRLETTTADGELMTKLGKHAVVLGASMGGLLAARVRRLKRLLIKKRAAIRVLDRPI